MSNSQNDLCPACNNPWDEHDFSQGVFQYCPPMSQKRPSETSGLDSGPIGRPPAPDAPTGPPDALTAVRLAGAMTVLPEDSTERKTYPLYSGLLAYFPNALALVARRSWEGGQQHHPDKPLHWDKNKSGDELDALLRHIAEQEWDAVAWRALAHLERMVAAGYNPHNHALDPDP